MKKVLGLFGAGLMAATLSQPATAADLETERHIGLIVSGVVDQWVGVQVIDVDEPTFDVVDVIFDDVPLTQFISGGEGLLSLPLGDNISIQNDFKYEYNDQAFDDSEGSIGPRYWYHGAAHLSWRDPMTGLFGVFGGMGGASTGYPVFDRQDYHFVGGEFQFYMDNLTFYGQGGFIDLGLRDGCGAQQLCKRPIDTTPDDGFFGRGVVRWFPTAQSRLQLEATYLNLTTSFFDEFETDTDVWSWKARYDFNLEGLPILGTLPLFLAYRGTLRSECGGLYQGPDGPGGSDMVDHTFMIGTSYSFSGDRLTIDRQGATLDTPDLGNMIGCRAYGDRT